MRDENPKSLMFMFYNGMVGFVCSFSSFV